MKRNIYSAETLKEARKLVVSLRRLWREMLAATLLVPRLPTSETEVPYHPSAMAVRAAHVTRWSALYLVFGLWGVHILHLCRFMLVGWKKISALPDWQIPLQTSFWLGLVLLPMGVVAVSLLRRWPRLFLVVTLALLYETLSQALGRSMFKLISDLGIWGTVLGGYSLRSYYSPHIVELLPPKQISAFHAEALGVLRTAVNVCLFVIGTLGIAVTSNLISRYFDTPLGQGTAWVHVGTMLYLALGMACFVVHPLFGSVVSARLRLSQS